MNANLHGKYIFIEINTVSKKHAHLGQFALVDKKGP